MMDIEKSNSAKRNERSKSKGSKSTPTGQFRTKVDDFKQPSSGKKILNERREDRLNRNTQMRKNKINDYVMKKRGLIDSDASDTSLNLTGSKMLTKNNITTSNLTNLTNLIDTTAYKIPPKLCALVALNEWTDLEHMMNNFEPALTEDKEGQFHRINEAMWTALVPHSLFKGKERLSMIKTKRDVYSILDTCKVADVILFVASCKKTEYSKWKTDPDKFSNAIDEFGYKILSMLRAQGFPQHVCIMQDADCIPQKHKSDIKKLFARYFESELKPDKIFNVNGKGNEDIISSVSESKDEFKSIIRFLCSVSPFSVSLDLRKHRSYMLCEKIGFNSNSDLELSGYIRGNTLNISNYVHLTGFGDYLVTNVEFDSDPVNISCYVNPKDIKLQTASGMELESAQVKSLDDQIESTTGATTGTGNKPQVISANFAKEEKSSSKKDEDDDVNLNFDFEIKDDGEDLSFDENEEEEDGKISNKHILKTTLKYRTQNEMEFPDEVDTPFDFPARERFRKYRGLASLKQGSWDPLENLPKEYANIYSFENLRYLYKLAVKKAHEEGMKISGNFVKITLKGFNKEDLNFTRADVPLLLSTLLDHERKLCVMHYKISLNYEWEGKLRPKQSLETQCGFRRLLTKPIYSSDISVVDKLKIEKSLDKDKFYIASVYSQMTYPHSPVLLFKPESETLNLVAFGEVAQTDSKRIILKRVILTGYPLKIKKKKSVVRFMFFNPNDVNYFRPIQLATKNGLRGHITESLGTHGHMKCVFNDHVKANDTVCLNLYKRVFPKWLKESWRYKVFYGNRNDYKNYFLEEKTIEKCEEADASISTNIIMNID